LGGGRGRGNSKRSKKHYHKKREVGASKTTVQKLGKRVAEKRNLEEQKRKGRE